MENVRETKRTNKYIPGKSTFNGKSDLELEVAVLILKEAFKNVKNGDIKRLKKDKNGEFIYK